MSKLFVSLIAMATLAYPALSYENRSVEVGPRGTKIHRGMGPHGQTTVVKTPNGKTVVIQRQYGRTIIRGPRGTHVVEHPGRMNVLTPAQKQAIRKRVQMQTQGAAH